MKTKEVQLKNKEKAVYINKMSRNTVKNNTAWVEIVLNT